MAWINRQNIIVGPTVTPDPPNKSQPPPTPSFTATPAAGAAPHLVAFRSTSTGSIEFWDWDFGEGAGWEAVAGPRVGHTYASQGSYTAKHRVRGPGGTSAEVTATIEVAAPVPAPVASSLAATPQGETEPVEAGISWVVDENTDRVVIEFGDGKALSRAAPDGGGDMSVAHPYLAGSWIIRITPFGPGGQGTSITTTLSVAAVVAGANTFPLQIMNGSTETLTNAPLIALASFAYSDNLLDTSGLQVLDKNNAPVPCQFKVLTRYGIGKTRDSTDAPIRFLQAVFTGSVAAGDGEVAQGTACYLLQTGASSQTTGGLTVQTYTNSYRVGWGTSYWDVPRLTASVLNEAVVDGQPAVIGPGSYDVTLKEGAASPTNIVTEIEEQGSTRVAIVQRGTLRETAEGDIQYLMRWTFHDQSNDVLIEHRYENDREWRISPQNQQYVDSIYLSVPVANNGFLRCVSASDTWDSPNGSTSRLHARMREMVSYHPSVSQNPDNRDLVPEGWPAGAQPLKDHRHILSYKEGLEGAEVDHAEEAYDSSFQVVGSVSVTAGVESFADKAPCEFKVEGGQLRVGLFPEGVPGDDHFKGNAFRGQYTLGPLDASPPGWLPPGNNPVTDEPWENLQWPPEGFPVDTGTVAGAWPATEGSHQQLHPTGVDGVIPPYLYTVAVQYVHDVYGTVRDFTVNPGETYAQAAARAESENPGWTARDAGSGWTYRGKPKSVVVQDARDYYRTEPGVWYGDRVLLRFEASTIDKSATELNNFQSLCQNPVAGIQDPYRFITTGAFGGWKWLPTIQRRAEGNASAHPDIDQFEKFVDLMVDDLKAEPTGGAGNANISETGHYCGWPALQKRGASRPGQTPRRVYGKDNFGQIWWQSLESPNLHYDPAMYGLLNFIRRQDYRYLNVFRRHVLWQRDRGHCHSSGSDYRGANWYEQALWIGHESKYPNASHTWHRGGLLFYLIFGDESSRESAEQGADFWTLRINGASPAGWGGRSGVRVPGWAIEGLTDIYVMLGDIEGREGRRVMAEAAAGVDLLIEYEQNVMGLDRVPVANGGQKVNIIRDIDSLTGQEVDVSGNGYILNYLGDNGVRGYAQTWLHMLMSVGVCYFAMSHPENDDSDPVWDARLAFIGRMRTAFRDQCTIDSTQYRTQIPNIWRPAGHVDATQTTNALPLWHGGDAFAYAHYALEGTSYTSSEDFTDAKLLFYGALRYHQRNGVPLDDPLPTVPNGIRDGREYGEPTSTTYDSDGNPVATAYLHPVNLFMSNGNAQVIKFFGQDHARRAYAVIRLIAEMGEAGWAQAA